MDWLAHIVFYSIFKIHTKWLDNGYMLSFITLIFFFCQRILTNCLCGWTVLFCGLLAAIAVNELSMNCKPKIIKIDFCYLHTNSIRHFSKAFKYKMVFWFFISELLPTVPEWLLPFLHLQDWPHLIQSRNYIHWSIKGLHCLMTFTWTVDK